MTSPAEQDCGGSSKGARSNEKLKAVGKCPGLETGSGGALKITIPVASFTGNNPMEI